jgi:hypothetical protein
MTLFELRLQFVQLVYITPPPLPKRGKRLRTTWLILTMAKKHGLWAPFRWNPFMNGNHKPNHHCITRAKSLTAEESCLMAYSGRYKHSPSWADCIERRCSCKMIHSPVPYHDAPRFVISWTGIFNLFLHITWMSEIVHFRTALWMPLEHFDASFAVMFMSNPRIFVKKTECTFSDIRAIRVPFNNKAPREQQLVLH